MGERRFGRWVIGFLQVADGEGGWEGELEGGAGDEVAGGEGEEGGAGLAGEVAEAVPGCAGDVLEVAEGIELEVEGEEREVAVAEKEVGATERFIDVAATDPKEAGTGLGTVGGGVEGITSVDEGDRDGLRFSIRDL